MKDYQKRAKFSKGQIMVLQSKLKIREEELKELRSHYFEIEKKLIRTKQKHQGCEDYIDRLRFKLTLK
jgi:hypothetical protein